MIFTRNENRHYRVDPALLAIMDIGYTDHNIFSTLNKHLGKATSISNTKYKRRGFATHSCWPVFGYCFYKKRHLFHQIPLEI